jgi:hypothetical protein
VLGSAEHIERAVREHVAPFSRVELRSVAYALSRDRAEIEEFNLETRDEDLAAGEEIVLGTLVAVSGPHYRLMAAPKWAPRLPGPSVIVTLASLAVVAA